MPLAEATALVRQAATVPYAGPTARGDGWVDGGGIRGRARTSLLDDDLGGLWVDGVPTATDGSSVPSLA